MVRPPHPSHRNHVLEELKVHPAHNTFFTMIGLPMPLPREAAELDEKKPKRAGTAF